MVVGGGGGGGEYHRPGAPGGHGGDGVMVQVCQDVGGHLSRELGPWVLGRQLSVQGAPLDWMHPLFLTVRNRDSNKGYHNPY